MNNQDQKQNSQAQVLETKNEEKRRGAVEMEIQQRAEERMNQAQRSADATKMISEGLESYVDLQNQSQDQRGQTYPNQLEKTENYHKASDGLAVGVVMAAHLAQKGGQYLQQKQNERIDKAINQQTLDPRIEAENKAREDALQADLARWRQKREQSESLQRSIEKTNDRQRE